MYVVIGLCITIQAIRLPCTGRFLSYRCDLNGVMATSSRHIFAYPFLSFCIWNPSTCLPNHNVDTINECSISPRCTLFGWAYKCNLSPESVRYTGQISKLLVASCKRLIYETFTSFICSTASSTRSLSTGFFLRK
jgi:hypothetical protein